MLRKCVCAVLVGLFAVSSASAASPPVTDLSGHSIEYDMLYKSASATITALEPVVKAVNVPDVTTSYNAWVNKFQKAAQAGTMTRQQSADNYAAFRATASELAPTFAEAAKAVLAKLTFSFFTFEAFMPAATYDIVEYGILHLKNFKFNTTTVTAINTYMTKNIVTANLTTLQSKLDTYLTASEKSHPGFRSALSSTLSAIYENAKANNPTVAPTTRPPTKTPIPSVTIDPTTTPGVTPTSTTESPATTTPAPTVDPEPVAESSISATTAPAATVAPTPAPTTKSSALLASANIVVSVAVLVVASALM